MEKQKIFKDKNINNVSMLPGDWNGSPDESFFFWDSKVYKCKAINHINMFPSDPTGSLDDFFLDANWRALWKKQ